MPGLRSLREIAEHIVRARALWLPRALDEGDAEVTELRQLESMANWDEPNDPTRTAAEVSHGLDLTWRLIVSRLAHRQAADLRDTIPARKYRG